MIELINKTMNIVINIGICFLIICIIVFFIFVYYEGKKIDSYQKNRNEFYRKNNKKTRDVLKEEKQKKWSKDLIDSLEWKRFEDLCTGYFIEKGYEAKPTFDGPDGGIDIHLFKETKAFAIVQCKAWSNRNIGVKPIREFFGVMISEESPAGIFITTTSYTKEAKEFSVGKKLKLISGDTLLRLIQDLPENKQQRLLSKITKGDYLTPSCPSCGIKMALRVTKKGRNIGNKFWGCFNYPRCKNNFRLTNIKK